jgi:hypothetical protein
VREGVRGSNRRSGALHTRSKEGVVGVVHRAQEMRGWSPSSGLGCVSAPSVHSVRTLRNPCRCALCTSGRSSQRLNPSNRQPSTHPINVSSCAVCTSPRSVRPLSVQSVRTVVRASGVGGPGVRTHVYVCTCVCVCVRTCVCTCVRTCMCV